MRVLTFLETQRLLAKHGFPLVKTVNDRDSSKLISKAQKLGFPIVLKAVPDNFTHKSELGLVSANVHNEGELVKKIAELNNTSKKVGARRVEFIAQKQLAGAEVIIGAKRDASFGPVVLFGLGGIYAELLNEVSVRLTPLSKHDAIEMIGQTRAQKLLACFRNYCLNENETAKLIIKTGKLIEQNRNILEIDFNPVITDEKRCTIVDARIVVD